jgi:hypothetical protein
MSATLQIVERIGDETELLTSGGYVHLLNSDVHSPQTPDGYSPLLLSHRNPYSYERWIRARFTGTYLSVRATKFWADNLVVPSGWAVKYGITDTWAPPVATASSIATTNVPRTIPSTSNVDDTGVLTGPGENYSKWIVIQAHVTNFSAITPGPLLGSTGTEVVIPTMIHYHFGWIES